MKKIAAVFVALGFALFASAGEDTALQVCKEKMTKIYNATMQYVKDHDGYLPPAYAQPDVEAKVKGKGMWSQALADYLAKAGEKVEGKYVANKKQADDTIFVCPANPYWNGGFGPNCLNYSWNDNLGIIYQRPNEPVTVAIEPVKLADVADPAHTVLLVDAASIEQPGQPVPVVCEYHCSNVQGIGFWHSEKANVLFLDGHIETLAREQVKNEWFQVKLK